MVCQEVLNLCEAAGRRLAMRARVSSDIHNQTKATIKRCANEKTNAGLKLSPH